ncbi:MAG: caspase family protein [Myxococcales bacterium]|nr:caspase family protein [Myxococcales bacterium]MCB9530386.1 caspase family protein [Myxococcales bacterium]
MASLAPRAPRLLPLVCVLVCACAGPQTGRVSEWNAADDGSVSGTLGADDATDDEGRWRDVYAVELDAGTIASVAASSEAFDTMLYASAPGLSLQNDDFGGGTNSALEFAVPGAPGERTRVTITVASFAPSTGGDYALELRTLDPAHAEARLNGAGTLTGRLSGADEGTEVASGGDVWIEASAGQQLRLRVTSPDFDTVATLFAPNGQTWFNDDANDTGPDGHERTLDSTINAVAPVSGWYHLVVGAYGDGGGNYQVRAQVRPAITVGPGEPRPTAGYAGTETEGRIIGVYVGITNYGPGEELYGCAADATNVGEAFRESRLQGHADQVILTDKRATRDGVEAALRDAARRAGPNDVFVFFYSGHGGVVPVDTRRDRVELDGTDETLQLYDGPLTDNDFAALLDLFRTNTIIVALDSCQSGGFARDIMTRPGRIGLFSSDEDVLSSTAEVLEAGGFLSAAFIDAVRGLADGRPRDGALQAGELTDYLLEAAVASHRDMNPEGSYSPLQRFVVERGSYAWADLLWVIPQRVDEAGNVAPVECDGLRDTTPVGGVCW